MPGGFFARHNISRMSYAQASESAIHRRIQFILFAALIWGVTATAYFRDLEAFYSLAAVSILSLLFWPVGWLVHHYFTDKDWLPAYFLILSALTFLLHLFASVGTDIHRIEHGEASNLKQYDIAFKESVAFNTETTVLLAANSGYLFLRDAVTGKVYIIPTDQVQNISVRNEGPIQPEAP